MTQYTRDANGNLRQVSNLQTKTDVLDAIVELKVTATGKKPTCIKDILKQMENPPIGDTNVTVSEI